LTTAPGNNLNYFDRYQGGSGENNRHIKK